MAPAQREAPFGNTARSLGGASLAVQRRHVANGLGADPAYGAGVAKALGLDQG